MDIETFFSKATGRTNPVNPEGITKLSVECAIYFNEHKEALDPLAWKLTYVIDGVYPRTKGAPSFENYVWALALITSAWNGWLREAKAIDRNNEPERQLLVTTVIPAVTEAAKIGREYAKAGVRGIGYL